MHARIHTQTHSIHLFDFTDRFSVRWCFRDRCNANNRSDDSYLKIKEEAMRDYYCQNFKYKNRRVQSERSSLFVLFLFISRHPLATVSICLRSAAHNTKAVQINIYTVDINDIGWWRYNAWEQHPSITLNFWWDVWVLVTLFFSCVFSTSVCKVYEWKSSEECGVHLSSTQNLFARSCASSSVKIMFLFLSMNWIKWSAVFPFCHMAIWHWHHVRIRDKRIFAGVQHRLATIRNTSNRTISYNDSIEIKSRSVMEVALSN